MPVDSVTKDLPSNPCCALWEKRHSKLQKKYEKLEDGRTALRRGIEILQQTIGKVQAENASLKKAYEVEKIRADNEREEKIKESAMRLTVENEISALKSEVASFQQHGGLGSQDTDEEVAHLRVRVCEGDAETNRLRELLEGETGRAESEKKKAEAEQLKANEARNFVEAERNKNERVQADNKREREKELAMRVSLENEISALKTEIVSLKQKGDSVGQDVDEVVTHLRARVADGEEEINRLKEIINHERLRADSEKNTAVAEKKKTAAEKKKTEAEKRKAEAEKRKTESEKKKANEAQEVAKAERRRADEERKLASIEGEKVEKQRLQLERSKIEADEAKSKLVLETSKSEEAKKKLEAEILDLKKCIELCEQQIAKLQTENLNLKKANVEEIARAENLKVQKENESATRVSLESEISALKSEIYVLQQKECSDFQDMEEEVTLLRVRVSERDAEINRIRGILEEERTRAVSQKHKDEAELINADEARKFEKAEESRVETLRAEYEREREKELAIRVSLENEISGLKSEMLLLQQKGCSKWETEMNQLKEALDNERTRADYETKKANEACAIVKKADEDRLQLERLKVEAGEAISKLACETSKSKEANEKLEAERLKLINEKKRADSEMAKAEEHRKLAETSRKKVMEEKCHADHLSQQLEAYRLKIEKLQREKDELQLSKKLVHKPDDILTENMFDRNPNLKGGAESKLDVGKSEEAKKRLEKIKKKANRERKSAGSEMRKLEAQKNVAASLWEKALYEQNRANKLSQQLEELREDLIAVTAEMKLLRKQLKIERMQIKHAKKGSKLEKSRNNILQQEFCCFKEDFLHRLSMLDNSVGRFKQDFLHRLSMLDNCFSHSDGGIDGLEKIDDISNIRRQNLKRKPLDSEPYQMRLLKKIELLRPCDKAIDASDRFKQNIECNASLLPLSGGNDSESNSGIDSKLEPLLRGSNRKLLKSSAMNSSMASFSDRPLVGSQGRGAFDLTESAKSAEEKSSPQPAISKLSDEVTETRYDENIAISAKNSVQSPFRDNTVGEGAGDCMKRKRILDDSFCSAQNKSQKKRKVCSEEEVAVGDMCNSNVRNTIGGFTGKGSFEEVVHGDYMKLLDLEDSADEETFRVAIEMPLSPTLPAIQYPSLECAKLNAYGTMVPCCSFDVMDDCSSIIKIFHATRTCMAQCSVVSDIDWVIRKILAFLKVEDLSPGEKARVFFSITLHKFSGIRFESFGSMKDQNPVFLDSFAGHLCKVLSDLEARSMFVELCNLDALITQIEDFLIDRRVLVSSNISCDSSLVSDLTLNLNPNQDDVSISICKASTQQLVAGAFILASICASVDCIDFLCEASYNIFRMQKFDSSMLSILHVFAYACGSKYLTPNGGSLIMTVMKSLVTHAERVSFSTDSGSSLAEGRPEFPSCRHCPFSKGAVPMDDVISLLLVKLQICELSDLPNEHLIESVNLLKAGALLQEQTETSSYSYHGKASCVGRRNCTFSRCLHKSGMTDSHSEIAIDENLCHIGDVLSLVELVACNMNWDWTSDNIVCHLLRMLESCILEIHLAAILILLGQLGRIGVDAKGYENTRVENLRDILSAFLSQCSSRKMGLPIQFATVTALLGVVSLTFEEIIKNEAEVPAVTSKCWSAELQKRIVGNCECIVTDVLLNATVSDGSYFEW